MRIAVVFYGQPRTWQQTMSRLLGQLSVLRNVADVDCFCNVKDYNSYANSVVDSPFNYQVSRDELDTLKSCVREFDPDCTWSVLTKEQEDLRKEFSWHYTPMFASMQMAAQPLWSRRCHYDVVLLSRYDVMYSTLDPLLHVNPMTIYSEHPAIRYVAESYSLGIQDYYVYGDRLSMQLLLSSTFSATSNLSYPIFKNFGFRGPGVYLRNLALKANLAVSDSRINLAIVRPSAPAGSSFQFHLEYWKQTHTAAGTASPLGSSNIA